LKQKHTFFMQRILFLLSGYLLFYSFINAQNTYDLRQIPIRSIGPAAMSGRITAITVDPTDPNVIYAGAASGGVWRSRSGGTNWEPIFDAAPTQSIGSIAINPNNPDDIWVGTGEGNPRNSQNFGAGVFRSLDGGSTWKSLGLERTRTIHRVIVHRDNPDVAWVAAQGSTYGPNEERGVFKTTDGGKTWRKTLYTNDLSGCAELVSDPKNPNKLIAAMWEYRRWPWKFKSGGAGSGLYVSHDGGETWEKRTERDGLPEGELGRLGLAIAGSNPDVVYALVEAKDNALYKSTDGGRKWRKMAEKNMGDRPFYYGEIYVDPSNENTVYSIHSIITRSIDGGKTFENLVGYWDIHPDHHAFWIHPTNGKYMINGNDGGLNITLDGGKTWRYADNIPVGQFYHVNVDMQTPYNIYGGLQDNGSWVGPSAVWKESGMRNSEWQEIYFGDGFDVVPQRDNPRYMFAMSQGGYLAYIDRQTGKTREIKPIHPDDKPLRFNWNSAIAQDPFRDHGLYFGSQFVHYSPDLGQTWQIISPDLSTNDTLKIAEATRTGGLTPDITNAENHCTILAIAPSPVQQGVIWASTDDGNLQLTQDGGKNWSNLTKALPGCPANAWMPQIEVSATNAGEAFVVVNNYRQNDWDAYLYHTTDFGKKWKRLVSPKNVRAFCLSVVQDPQVPNLLFLGTDQGLYVSFDYGDNWQHWYEGSMARNNNDLAQVQLPCVPVQDMKIHPRDGDLVIGTFGRAFWVLDNLSPLRELARNNYINGAAHFKLFPAQEGILANFASYQGPRFVANETFIGQNKSPIVAIPVWKKAPEPAAAKGDDKKEKADKDKKEAKKSKKEEAIVMVMDMKGDTIRRFKSELDSGYNRIYWMLDTRGVALPNNRPPNREQLEPGGGPYALPGTYKVKVHIGKHTDSVQVVVKDDPRVPENLEDRKARFEAIRDFQKTIEQVTKTYNRLKEAEKTIGLVESQWANVPDSLKKETLKLGTALKDSIATLKGGYFSQKEEGKGIQRSAEGLNPMIWRAMGYLNDSPGAPSASAQIAVAAARKEAERLQTRVDALFEKEWKVYRERAEALKYSLFKD
jgi:photosystem II stability/assembly factor-like uncharacterized protein